MSTSTKKPVALVAFGAAAALLVAGSTWWVSSGSKPVSQQRTLLFMGRVVSANTGAEEASLAQGWACIRPEAGEVSGAAAGEDWCGPVYPSEGLHMAGLTAGLEVRVLAFDSSGRIADGSSIALRGALVVPISAPIPGSGQPSNTQIPSPLETKAFAPHLVGLTEADAATAANSLGFTVRVASVDGKENLLTTDLRINRINLTLVKNVVTKVEVG